MKRRGERYTGETKQKKSEVETGNRRCSPDELLCFLGNLQTCLWVRDEQNDQFGMAYPGMLLMMFLRKGFVIKTAMCVFCVWVSQRGVAMPWKAHPAIRSPRWHACYHGDTAQHRLPLYGIRLTAPSLESGVKDHFSFQAGERSSARGECVSSGLTPVSFNSVYFLKCGRRGFTGCGNVCIFHWLCRRDLRKLAQSFKTNYFRRVSDFFFFFFFTLPQILDTVGSVACSLICAFLGSQQVPES